MLIVRGVNVFPGCGARGREQASCRGLAATSSSCRRARGWKQEPPLPVRVELARGVPHGRRPRGCDPCETPRDVLVVTTRVDLVPWGSIERSAYKSTLVEAEGPMRKLQGQGVHHITLVGADRQTSIDFWEGVLGMPFVFEQPNLDNAAESHLYFDPGDGRLDHGLHERGARARPERGRRDPGNVQHVAIAVSQATFAQAVERLDERGIRALRRQGPRLHGLDLLRRPARAAHRAGLLWVRAATGHTHADVLLEAHRLRVEPGTRASTGSTSRMRWRSSSGARAPRCRTTARGRTPTAPDREDHMAANTLSILKPSVNNLTTRIFVRAAGLEFDEVDVWGKKSTSEFLSKDPADLTPLLEEEGLPKGALWESCAIMQYLCNKHGLDRFYPTDPGERAMVDSAMFYLDRHALSALSCGRRTRASGSGSTPARWASSAASDELKAGAQKDAEAALAGPLDVYRAFFLNRKTFHRRRRAVDRGHALRRLARVPARDRLPRCPTGPRSTCGRWRTRSARRTPSRRPTCAGTSTT